MVAYETSKTMGKGDTMYYIYTVEGSNGIYVGATQNPLVRMYAHGRSREGIFFLRHQYKTAKEACEKETELIKSLGAVNKILNTWEIGEPVTRRIVLSAKVDMYWKKAKPRKRVSMLGGKVPSVLHNRRWHRFDSISDAEVFIDGL